MVVKSRRQWWKENMVFIPKGTTMWYVIAARDHLTQMSWLKLMNSAHLPTVTEAILSSIDAA